MTSRRFAEKQESPEDSLAHPLRESPKAGSQSARSLSLPEKKYDFINVMNFLQPPYSYVEALIPCTSECDYI